jgi:hypothetical protein
MAKLISIVGSLSGKLAGTVYSHNRWGGYIRQLVMPTQPRTSHQQNQRGRIAACAEEWSQLSVPQQLGWNSYATLIVRNDRLGQPLSYNGFTAFVLVNSERLICGESIKADAPMFWSGYQPDQIIFDVTDDTMTLTNVMQGGNSLVSTGTSSLLAWSCPAQQNGAMFAKTWRMFSISNASTNFPIDLTTAYEARFGPIVAATGKRYFLGVTLVNHDDAVPGAETAYVSTRVDLSVLSTVTP